MAEFRILTLDGVQLVETLPTIDDVSGQIRLPISVPVDLDHAASKGYVDQQVASIPAAPQLPANMEGVLYNDGSGVLTWIEVVIDWSQITNIPAAFPPDIADPTFLAYMDTKADALPPDAAGVLVNDGAGSITWDQAVVEWVDVLNKPAAFPPDMTDSAMQNALNLKADLTDLQALDQRVTLLENQP